ncbi:MAG: lipid A biosynthesis acyltransferase [Gammaproteobacteria bacterium]|nr:MAG: lipid A biosynthesis acyltransferase [Gammaproteobacteria bacterium]
MNNLNARLGLTLARLIVRLPRPMQYGLGRLLGKFLYRFGKRRRHIAEVNISLCFPELSDEQQKILVRKVFTENAIGFIETAVSWFRKPEYSYQHIAVEGLEYLEAAKSLGRGVILVGSHFSTLDLGGLLVTANTKLDASYRPQKNQLINDVMLKSRQGFLERVISHKNMREIIKSLKDGHVLWYAPDQDYGRKVSVFAPFFGIEAATVKFTAKLAKVCNSPVVVLGHYRKADDSGYVLSYSKALEGFPSGDEVADATQVNQAIEHEIRKCPEQYMWVHRRFKTRPEGEDGFY